MERRNPIRSFGLLAALLCLACIAPGAAAQGAMRIKLGTLAPKGSLYHKALLDMGEKWRHAQGGGANFTVFTDGTQGSEADIVRRMRVGQLNAALLTVIGMSEIDPSVTALQKMPMMFRSWDEVDYVREKMRAKLEQRLEEKGFVVLFWAEAGWVRFFAKEAVLRPEDFRRKKIFAWSGDNDQVEIMKAMGYQPVVLETADIMPALQTGLINVVPCASIYALALQFHGPAPHVLDINWVPIVGATVVTRKAWDAMTPAAREELRRAADIAGADIRAKSRVEDREALEAMKKRGLKVHVLTPEADAEWRKLSESVYPMIRGRMVPADTFDEVRRLLADYRAGGGGK